jgi:hypothetical protein
MTPIELRGGPANGLRMTWQQGTEATIPTPEVEGFAIYRGLRHLFPERPTARCVGRWLAKNIGGFP